MKAWSDSKHKPRIRIDSLPVTYLKFIMHCARTCPCLGPVFPKDVSHRITPVRQKGLFTSNTFGTEAHLETHIHVSTFKAEGKYRTETCIIAINMAFPKLLWLLKPLTISWFSGRKCYMKNEYHGCPGGPFSILFLSTPLPALSQPRATSAIVSFPRLLLELRSC